MVSFLAALQETSGYAMHSCLKLVYHIAQTKLGLNLPSLFIPNEVQNGTMKVACIGYSRTGTRTLGKAITELGFPTLHSMDLNHVQNWNLFDMLVNDVVEPAINNGQPQFLGKIDWQLLADHNYSGVADLPFALYYEQLLNEFPDTKFILTIRENSDQWYRSFANTFKAAETADTVGRIFPAIRKSYPITNWIVQYTYNDTEATIRNENKERAIATYEAHNERVRRTIPKRQLLEYSVNEGWESLCEFLEVQNCPTKPFPHDNTSAYMQTVGFVAIGGVSVAAVSVLCTLSCLLYTISNIVNTKKSKVV